MADDSSNRSTQVGHLISQIVSSLRPEAGATGGSVTRPSGSETTTPPMVPLGPIGQQPGGSGSSVPTAILPIEQRVARLGKLRPWLPQSVTSSIGAVHDVAMDRGDGYGFDSRLRWVRDWDMP